MAHFAEIRSDDNKVLRVVVINNEDVAIMVVSIVLNLKLGLLITYQMI